MVAAADATLYDEMMIVSVILGYVGTKICAEGIRVLTLSLCIIPDRIGWCRPNHGFDVRLCIEIHISSSASVRWRFHLLFHLCQDGHGSSAGPRAGWGNAGIDRSRAWCQVGLKTAAATSRDYFLISS